MDKTLLIETGAIRVEREGALAIASLVQPARGNPFDGRFTRELRDVALALHDADGLRGLLLRAEGPHFSYGGDLKQFAQSTGPELGRLVRLWTADLHMGLQRLWTLPVPIVCAAQGFAMGGAVALLAGCDVVLAAEGARFGSAFAQLGFSCDTGATVTLTARMGMARARRFMLLAEMLNAADALQTGLVDRVVPDAGLQEEALSLARRLADGPTQALGEMKRLFLRAGAAQLQSQLEDEALTLARLAAGADAQEGIAATLQKRAPIFLGR